MGGTGVGLELGGGSRGASAGGFGTRAMFSPFALATISPIRCPTQTLAGRGGGPVKRGNTGAMRTALEIDVVAQETHFQGSRLVKATYASLGPLLHRSGRAA